MKVFPAYTPETAPEAAKPILLHAAESLGFVPNLYAQLAGAPEVLEAYRQLMRQFERCSLSSVERQVVLLTVSVENCCRFCVPTHSFIAKQLMGVPEAVVEAIRDRVPIDDLRLEVLRMTTLKLMRERGYLSAEALADFVAAGFRAVQALEILLGISAKTLSNFSNHLMDTEPQQEFAGEAWEPPEWRLR